MLKTLLKTSEELAAKTRVINILILYFVLVQLFFDFFIQKKLEVPPNNRSSGAGLLVVVQTPLFGLVGTPIMQVLLEIIAYYDYVGIMKNYVTAAR